MKDFKFDLDGQEIFIQTGKLAQQCNGSVVVSIGETTILATATMSKEARDGVDFLPLTVNYQEKYYASGHIKSSKFVKREGRPSDDKILTSRLIDRQLRPLFDKHIHNDIQVILTTLSYDKKNNHDMVSTIAASCALAISDIPWNGPTASVRVGMIDGELICNPDVDQMKISELDLIVASSEKNVVMIEAGANQIPEEKILEAINFGKEKGRKICQFISKIALEIGKEKIFIKPIEEDKSILNFVEENYKLDIEKCIFEIPNKIKRFSKKNELKKHAKEKYIEQQGEEKDVSQFDTIFDKVFKSIIRDSILNNEKRIAGRKLTEIRKLSSDVSLLKRPHGSGLFNRGETQCLSVLTLAAPGNELIIEGIEGESKERYMHHYNFPPFSVGECSNRLFTGNREIGHGALAERALKYVLPDEKDFPYIIRVVSEILSSNGSSSMAATCGSTLALMDGGVPIKEPVSGIAMGLITDKDGNFKILSDIQDEEDFGGDMDFKVAGTKNGITAIQMDVKISGISEEIFKIAFSQAKKGRLQILESMLDTINEPRKDISKFAPRLISIKIDKEKIGDVIGKGGETINKIIEKTGVEINIDEEGVVVISSSSLEQAEEAKNIIVEITTPLEVGNIYTAKVTRIEDYGAFVELKNKKQGLVHISEISNERVKSVSDILEIGQEVNVKLMQIDSQGRLNLSIKKALPNS